MRDSSDMELVREYARLNSEAAFAEVVQRHINLVYSVALRHVGIAAQAEEITQAVFILLARKAASLRPDTVLDGWLFETTRLTSLSEMRSERRRQFREQEAYMQSTLAKSPEDPIWQQFSPLLDEGISRLGEKDRDVMLLRYFKGKTVREVAEALQVNESAAQHRILRALEKLRKYFAKRGVNSTTEIIAGAMSANSVQAAPVALTMAVTAVAIAKGATASISTLTLIKGTLKFMTWAKAQTAIGVGACVLLTAATATTMVHYEKTRPVIGLPNGWSVLSGNTNQWIWTNGAIKGHSANGDTMLASTKRYGDVTISAMVHSTNRDADFALRMQDAENGYLVCFAPAGTPWAADNGSHIQLRKRISGNESDVATSARPGLPQSGKLTVVAKGPHIEVRWNDITVLKADDSTFTSGFIGVRVFGDPGKPSDGTFSNLTFY